MKRRSGESGRRRAGGLAGVLLPLLLHAGTAAGDLLANGDFDDGMNAWSFFAAAGAAGQPGSSSGELCVDLTAPGANPWDVVFFQLYLPIHEDGSYRIRFSGRAAANRNIDVSVSMAQPPYTAYHYQTASLTPTPQVVQQTFQMAHPGDVCAQLVFHLGGRGTAQVCIDDVSLELLAAGDPLPTPPPAPPTGTTPLRQEALGRLHVGAMAEASPFFCDAAYREILAREYDVTTVGNALKFEVLRPEPATFAFRDADAILDFAEAHGMQMHGTVLVWHEQLPAWLTAGGFDEPTLRNILQTHIQTVVSRYAGRIASWDVVGEAIADDGSLRNSFWLQGIGPEYIDLAFQWARAADPGATLVYHDYNIEGAGVKSDAVYTLVNDLVQRGIPIDAVGFQSHFITSFHPPPAAVAANMARYAALGLDILIGEMDVRILEPASPEELTLQAQIYRDMLETCLAQPRCKRFMTWGFTDAYSWIPAFFPGYGSALPFDAGGAPKPAYFELHAALESIPLPSLSLGGAAGAAFVLLAAGLAGFRRRSVSGSASPVRSTPSRAAGTSGSSRSRSSAAR